MRLLEWVHERICCDCYSIRSEDEYVYWVRGPLRFNGLKHSKEMGVDAVAAGQGADRGLAQRIPCEATQKTLGGLTPAAYAKVLALKFVTLTTGR